MFRVTLGFLFMVGSLHFVGILFYLVVCLCVFCCVIVIGLFGLFNCLLKFCGLLLVDWFSLCGLGFGFVRLGLCWLYVALWVVWYFANFSVCLICVVYGDDFCWFVLGLFVICFWLCYVLGGTCWPRCFVVAGNFWVLW